MAQSLIAQTRTDERGSGSAGVKDDVSMDKSLSCNSCCWSYSKTNTRYPVPEMEMQGERKGQPK